VPEEEAPNGVSPSAKIKIKRLHSHSLTPVPLPSSLGRQPLEHGALSCKIARSYYERANHRCVELQAILMAGLGAMGLGLKS